MDLWGSEDEDSGEDKRSSPPPRGVSSDKESLGSSEDSNDAAEAETQPFKARQEGKLGFYKARSRSSSVSRSLSRSKSVSRSRSSSASRSRSRSISRSISRSVSRSISRSRSHVLHKSESDEENEGDHKSGQNNNTGLGLDLSESEEENEAVLSTSNKASRISRESRRSQDDSSEDEGPSREAQRPQPQKRKDDSSDDEGLRRNDDDHGRERGGNDFDNMLQRKREMNRRLRRKKDIDVINNNDDAIAQMLADMRIAAKEDRDLNDAGQPATKKMAIFKRVMQNLGKVELQMAFVEANLLSVMTDWLAPMPDKSLPHVFIRTELLKLISQLKLDDTSRLKESGIGKAVMYLYRHPKETRENKGVAGKIINEWARPIFHKETDFKKLTREDRRENDDLRAKRAFQGRKRHRVEESEEPNLKPGDPGWVGRARVPMPDNQEYIKRPQWQNDVDIPDKVAKKGISMLEKHKRKFAERKRINKNLSMVKISIEGARMGLG